jgi:acetylornithine deacetylase/succinyl-diaminopimelate desuccinylase-like protein
MRIILAGILTALLAGAATGQSAPLPPPENQALAHDILKDLVGIDTVHDHGTKLAAEAAWRRLKAAGFADQDLSLLPIPEHPDQVQLVVRLRAAAPRAKPVLWIGHLDVVEARREDWTVDPFQLTEKDGWWYGRGSLDMKGDDAAALAALIRLKQEAWVPDRDIIIALTSDEEGGDANGVSWLLKTHRPLIDAGLVINPDAGGGALRGERRLFYGIQTSEKVYVTYQLETTNRGGHSSEPRADNAIYELAAGLQRVERLRFPVHTTATTRAYFEKTAALASGRTAADMRAVAKSPPDLAAAQRLSVDPDVNAHLRTTCVATQLSGGHAENALPQRARAVIQCRMIPSDNAEGVKRALVAALDDPKIAVTVIWPADPAPDSPPEPALMDRFTQVIHSEWPGVMVLPTMDLGASDSVYTRLAGLPSYGLASIWSDVDDVRAHGRDERIEPQHFYAGVEFDYRLMKALAGAP